MSYKGKILNVERNNLIQERDRLNLKKSNNLIGYVKWGSIGICAIVLSLILHKYGVSGDQINFHALQLDGLKFYAIDIINKVRTWGDNIPVDLHHIFNFDSPLAFSDSVNLLYHFNEVNLLTLGLFMGALKLIL
jgi:hypothetical protein